MRHVEIKRTSMKTQLYVDNIKNPDCAATIKSALIRFPEVSFVVVDTELNSVEIEHNDLLSFDKVIDKLASVEYPEMGSSGG